LELSTAKGPQALQYPCTAWIARFLLQVHLKNVVTNEAKTAKKIGSKRRKKRKEPQAS
jgi:hypothetical protein